MFIGDFNLYFSIITFKLQAKNMINIQGDDNYDEIYIVYGTPI